MPGMSSQEAAANAADSKQEQYDAEQLRLMAEQCIVVDMDDKAIGAASKKKCHKNVEIEKGLLHRAFSVFLFNTKGELLLHQRAAEKITFPLYWTNTCCSHPLHFAEELEEKDSLGVKHAAVRKLEHELGIKKGDITYDDLKFLTRIYYKATSDGEWGEHEIDHILFVQKDVQFKLNPNEIAATRWINADDLLALFEQRKKDPKLFISPWFEMIARTFVMGKDGWWANLPKVLAGEFVDKETAGKIHRLDLKSMQ